MADFPTVYWPAWDVDATFEPGEELPAASAGRLWAVLGFVFYGDKVVLADIEGRGWCIPSGRIEAGETIDQAMERECLEETGAILHPRKRRLIGCYRLLFRSGERAGQVRYCPVFIAEALGFEPILAGTESRGMLLASVEDVADIYYFWDALMASVFAYAEAQKDQFFVPGTPLSDLINEAN
jgi:8-oxo-dGTP diphosphatase